MPPQKKPRPSKPKLPLELPPLHPRYDRSQWLLRDIVSIFVFGTDGTRFSTDLTRVPCVGETIGEEARIYRVLDVQHCRVDADGRAMAGSHAYIIAEEVPDEDPPPAKKARRTRKTTRRQ